ncbi:hypothetical protein HS1genome_1549 [Sulfodiicoccus acidiphilus]|uniref:ABC transporter domain-containing protein n=2 Tax=Sulfodiicoccus acidiphilus TaxID=1670455 RepID=A0A348B4Q8_9CREN|nr:hypothetical protein HS1genome_1549 [Sulfodiicoccus acidiphilus]GGU01221.1 hypothetical protein GCM10007116_17970 [Sulfodiicoccus acidiphilus]
MGDGVAEQLAAAGESEVEEKVSKALEVVGLDPEVRFRYPLEFSGGQRISIARAIIGSLKYLILDEPTSNFYVSMQVQVLNLFLDI